MPNSLRIATFNLENLDDGGSEDVPLAERIPILRPQLIRLRADVIAFQEVHGQERTGEPRDVHALRQLLQGTGYETFHLASTELLGGGGVYDKRNLVVVSRYPILENRQLRHDIVQQPRYRKVTANPAETDADAVTWERPLQYLRIQLPTGRELHLVNLHLKSKLPSNIPGQRYYRRWRSASAWAEGFFLSSLKRVGQALECRLLVDQIFDAEADALVVVCGDFNAEPHEVPCEAIRGEVENTENPDLRGRVLVPIESSIPESTRYTLFHRGRGNLLDHMLVSRGLLAFYRGAEIHNELLHDESVLGASDQKFPESDHAPMIGVFELP